MTLSCHALGLAVLLHSDLATAFAPRTTPGAAAHPAAVHGLQRADGAPVRDHRPVAWNRTPAPALRLHAALASALAATDTIWDRDTGVPLRIWGAGVVAPGSVADPAVALRHARELLQPHLALLAPGAGIDDLVLVSNDLSAGIRSLGFRQHHRGRPVLGGQLSVRFKADRLVMIGSEALPRISAELSDAPIDPATASARALAWVLHDAAATATVTAVDGPFILPLVAGRSSYREVLRVHIDGHSPVGRYLVYVDAATGQPVAREQTLHFATGTLKFDVPKRGPQGVRSDEPATRLKVSVADMPAVTDAAGKLTIPDGKDAMIHAGVSGELVNVTNQAGDEAETDLVLKPGGSVTWSAAKDELVDAQLASYVHATQVKEYVRGIAPDFAYLDKKLAVRVNINDVCNAFSDGDSINFFSAGGGCENTGRIADIVYHEYGHSVHQQSLIQGVGAFDGALSEGISDYLSGTITDDSGLGRGFFIDAPDGPLREMNPDNEEARWPEDISGGDPHYTGLIIAGALWDLRADLRDKLGAAEGTAHTDTIWFESIRRAVDIPSMYPEALLVDDDDGDLSNGTPNECEINRAFYAHGLLGPGDSGSTVSVGAPQADGIPVTLAIAGKPKACVDLVPESAVLRWRRFGSDEVSELPMNLADQSFTALLPIEPDDTVLEYQISAALPDASTVHFPINIADPWYQHYQGPVTELYCSGFEGPAGGEGWDKSGGWEQGPPTGQGGDPTAAYEGSDIFGINLAGTYKPKSSSTLTSPLIPIGDFKKVRLQYRRWLAVEDAHFDQATIIVSGLNAWRNVDSKMGDASNVQHRDLEWRFHDIDITPGIKDGNVQVAYQLRSDQGLELAGWNIDDFCVVGVHATAAALCGNGKLEGDEACDDGNQTPLDGCDAECQLEDPNTPTTSDSDADNSDSDTEDASASDTEADTAETSGELDDEGCGCRSTSPQPLAPLALGLLLLRRRRR